MAHTTVVDENDVAGKSRELVCQFFQQNDDHADSARVDERAIWEASTRVGAVTDRKASSDAEALTSEK